MAGAPEGGTEPEHRTRRSTQPMNEQHLHTVQTTSTQTGRGVLPGRCGVRRLMFGYEMAGTATAPSGRC